MKTKKKMVLCLLCLLLTAVPARPSEAVVALPIIGLIKEAVKKVIKAIDLRIQRLQNKTIWLQNAQKKIENALHKLKLDEISEWSKKQKELYQEYYEELMEIKSVISGYRRIRNITEKQIKLVEQYQTAWGLFQQDTHFNDEELEYMQKVYSGILEESIRNIDQIFLILESYTLQMSDAKRLELINSAADQIDMNYDDLQTFNRQNIKLSLQRAKTQNDVDAVRKFYAILN